MPENNDYETLQKNLEELLEAIDKLPGAKKIKKDIKRLKAILIDKRAPRVAVFGPRGSGKSSLANACLGYKKFAEGTEDTTLSPQWVTIGVEEGCKFDWLDTMGTGAEGKKEERLNEVSELMRVTVPDVMLLIMNFDDIDKEIDSILQDAKAIFDAPKDSYKAMGVLTKVDRVPDEDEKVDYSEEKLKNINRLVKRFSSQLNDREINVQKVLAVSSKFNPHKKIDHRFNIDELLKEIYRLLPDEASLEAARVFKIKEIRNTLANTIIHSFATTSFGIGAAPLPGADIIPLTSLQVSMITALAYLGGKRIETNEIVKFMAFLGGNIAIGLGLRALLRILPFAGWAASGAVAAAGTEAIGQAAKMHYIEGVGLDEVKSTFNLNLNIFTKKWNQEESSSK